MVFSVSAYLCFLMKAHKFLSATSPVHEFGKNINLIINKLLFISKNLEIISMRSLCNGMSVMDM